MSSADQIDFDPAAMLRLLVEHGVEFVVIGGMAAAMHGSDHVTTDLGSSGHVSVRLPDADVPRPSGGGRG